VVDSPAPRDLCILILQYNATDLTQQLLHSLAVAEADNLHRYRVLVMDNGSDEPGGDVITGRFPFVQFRAFGANLGFAAAHNRALEAVREPWVLLLNNDCILVNDAVQRTRAGALAAGADFATCGLLNADHSPQAGGDRQGLLGRRQRLQEGRFSTAPTPLRRILLNFTGINRLLLEPLRTRLPVCRVGYVNGAFLLLRRDRIPPPALFDERYFMYTEDLDLMIRLHRAGRRGIRVGAGRVVHLGGASAARAWGDADRRALKDRQARECMGRHYRGWPLRLWDALARLRAWLHGGRM